MSKTPKVVGINKKRLTKKEKLYRQAAEARVKNVARNQIEDDTPQNLSEIAGEEYRRVVDEAKSAGLLDNLDLAFLAMYADNWARYTHASAQLNKYGDVIKTDKGIAPSPYLSIMEKSANIVLKCSTKLGLATTDRLKLTIPHKEEKKQNKFLKFLEA